MAFEDRTDELTCQACGAKHVAKWSRMPMKEPHRIGCRRCRAILVEGASVRDYHDVYLSENN